MNIYFFMIKYMVKYITFAKIDIKEKIHEKKH